MNDVVKLLTEHLKKPDTQSYADIAANFMACLDKKSLQRLIKCHELVYSHYLTCCLAQEQQPDPHNLLFLANILLIIYDKYLITPSEVKKLSQDIEVLQKHLVNDPYTHKELVPINAKNTELLREKTTAFNTLRQLCTRSRQLILISRQLAETSQNYILIINSADSIIGPFFAYFNWLFFLPRMLANFAMIAKHTINHSWLTDEQKKLTWYCRFATQLSMRWPELTKDISWFVVGIINCFVLVGSLAPFAIYLSVSRQFFDATMVAIRGSLTIRKLQNLLNYYKNMKPSSEKEELITNLKLRIEREMLKVGIEILHAFLVVAVLALTIPLLSFNPIIAIVGLSAALILPFTNYFSLNYLENKKPKSPLRTSSSHYFFKPTSDKSQDNVTKQQTAKI